MNLRSVFKKISKSFYSQENENVPEITGECSLCNRSVGFYPLPDHFIEKYTEHELNYSLSEFETLNFTKYSCSSCGSSDRDRLITLYLKDYLKKIGGQNIRMLDFGPSGCIKKFLSKKRNIDYVTTDFYRKDVSIRLDIRQMDKIADNTFDAFICSHVLEHIDHDLMAMNELYRITKKGGIGILLVPIISRLDKSVENPEYLESIHLRWKHFAQNDHVRMYSKSDFVDRLSGVGFQVEQYGSDFFGKEVFKRSGITPSSVLYVVRK